MINQKNRFKGHSSLNYVYRHGKVVRSRMLSLKYAPNKKRQNWRLAVVVSKKVQPSAVKRNRIRRRLFESVRTQVPVDFSHIDMVLTVHDKNIEIVEAKDLQKTIQDLLTTVLR